MSTSNLDLAEAKDRLVDTLSTARDATRTAMREDIVPAVSATLGAAKDASVPLRAEAMARATEAAARAGEMTKAIGKSDVAKAVRNSDVTKRAKRQAKKLARERRGSRGKRLGVVALVIGAAGAAVALARQRGTSSAGQTEAPYPPPAPTATPAEAAPATTGGVAPAESQIADNPSV